MRALVDPYVPPLGRRRQGLLGSAGVAGAIASLMVGFAQAGSLQTAAMRLGVLIVGLGLLWWMTTLDSIERLLRRVIERGLERRTDLHVLDYVQLLGMERGYEVHELKVMEGDRLAYKSLGPLDLSREGDFQHQLAKQLLQHRGRLTGEVVSGGDRAVSHLRPPVRFGRPGGASWPYSSDGSACR